MNERSPGGNGRGVPSWIWPALVYAIAVGCLLWVYWDFDWRTELPKIRRIHWSWIIVAVGCDLSVYVCQAWRWNLLLMPVARVPLWRSVRAIFIGLFANEVLPLRSGEAIRCYLQAHWSKIPFAVAVSSALIERLIDGLWLIFGFLVAAFFVELPEDLRAGASVLAAVVGAMAVLLVFAIVHKERTRAALSGNRLIRGLRHLIEGLHIMGGSRSFLYAALASVPYLLLQVIPIYAMIRGYGAGLSIGAAAIVLVVMRLGTVIPGPPGNIGLFNAFAVLGLTLLGVDKQTAKGLSGVMFFVITVPLLIAGSLALAATGLKIGEIHRDAHNHLRNHRGVPTHASFRD